MYGKKTRIISFLMAFLLIFTFAFINPLTVSKSHAVAPVLTVAAQRIIAGVLISSGIVIKGVSDLTDTQKQDMMDDLTSYVWWTMSLVEKATLLSLQIIDNVVSVPINIYNSIKDKAQKITVPNSFSTTLEAQGITTKYSAIESSSVDYGNIDFPIYEGDFVTQNGYVRFYDMTEAEPFLVYTGERDATALSVEHVTTNIFNDEDSTENIPSSANPNIIHLTPANLEKYNIPVYSDSYKATVMTLNSTINSTSNTITLYMSSSVGGGKAGNYMVYTASKKLKDYPLYNNIYKFYFIKKTGSSNTGVLLEVYDLDGNFIFQHASTDQLTSSTNTVYYGINVPITQNYSDVINQDMTFEVESNPAPVVTNTEATENILTLPSDLTGSVGITSTQVNVGSTDVPDTPNTETMDNINTNVGELVTGGEIGEQVNTNIGTLEGLHGEITEQVDFGAIFDTIAEYISSLDISSVTWFPTAVASFVIPFMPLISLGIILFFIDRVLNGGA